MCTLALFICSKCDKEDEKRATFEYLQIIKLTSDVLFCGFSACEEVPVHSQKAVKKLIFVKQKGSYSEPHHILDTGLCWHCIPNKFFSPSWHQPSGSDPDMSAFKGKRWVRLSAGVFTPELSQAGTNRPSTRKEGTLQAQNGRLDASATHIWKSLGFRLSISSVEENNYICGHKSGKTQPITEANVNVITQLGHSKSKQHGYVTRPYQSSRLSWTGMLIQGE